MKLKKFLSLLLSTVMILSTATISVFADTTPAESAVIYLTVSNQGILAADTDGEVMANREVTVIDLNEDGILTVDEALAAAHKVYNSESGYAASDYGVSKLWGIDTYNTLFFINNVGIESGVRVDTVSEGDKLIASVNKDDTYYADWYTFFDSDAKTVKTGEEFTLTLKGHLGMAYTDEDKADAALSGISIGTWKNGSFNAIDEKKTDKDGQISLSFDKAGTYYISADGTVKDTVTDWSNGGATLEADCPIIAPICIVDVESFAPTSITIGHNAENIIDGKIITKKGDKFKLTAYDENGSETPVVWKNTSPGGGGVTLDENTGDVEVISDIYNSTSYLYFSAASTLDETVSAEITVQATGYLLSEYQKAQTVVLSEDGQTAKTASLTAGQKGHNIWSYDIPEGIAKLAAEPGTGNTIKFNIFRPGTFNITFKLDINEELTDTATVTVSGVAVEDAEGNNGKTYLDISAENPNPTAQLTAFVADGRIVNSWKSADEAVAAVDENGLVTANGIGSTIITAIDSEGTKGGIKVVVESEETPYFERLEFASTAFNSGVWVKDTTFVPNKLEYDLPIKNYSTSSLALQASTLYDTQKYTAAAEYTDVYGEKQTVTINSGKITTLANQPFDNSVMTITIWDKNNTEKKTVYTFNVSRPRDTTKAVKSSGITLSPTGRELSNTAYNGIAEGTMRKADESGNLISGTGVNSSTGFYRTFIYDDVESFKLNIASSTAYAHIRYSTDGGSIWKEIAQGGGVTNVIALPESAPAEITIQIIDDAAYNANIQAEQDGFFETEPAEYKLWVDKVNLSSPQILTAEATGGDWYPSFNSELYSYWIVTENNAEAPVLTYTVADGNIVTIGTAEQTPDEDGKYTLTLGTSQKSVTVTSQDGNFTNTYKFAYKKKSALDVPDKVLDYLCIGSQYTNAGYGSNPEQTLSGGLKSLGNFGGYITYYYEEPITDNPNNKYGMDFYVIGNSSETNIDSMAELGQVYISEDGETWYALAGSEHYEDKAIWDYTITYTKGDDGKSYWTDNQGNSIDYAAKPWPSASVYYMNNTANENSYSFTGVVFESQLGSIMGDSSSTASFASNAKFGYADYYASNVSGTTLTDVNSYVENPSKANGFDVAWAVDGNGIPVDVSEKKFHYIKIATASNIYAGMFAEKSTEVTYVIRTTAQNTTVGKTTAPAGVTISDGAESKTVNFSEGQNVYPINLDNMKYVSVKVNGTSDKDNIYINNQRVISENTAQGFKVTKENGETLVRIIVQNGDKEPVIYLLKLTSNALESSELVEGIKINADGAVRETTTKDGINYTANVGHRISSIAISPVIAQNVSFTVNGEELIDSYELSYGKNTFEITATDINGNSETVTLTITRDNAPASTGKNITVKFTLYGDEKHGNSEVHTYKNDKNKLPVWISQKSFTVDSSATVLDVFEKALTEADLDWKNDSGNYISQINGLAEFDNGALSGWMYFLNGTHPGLGVSEQTLKNGDSIIFHYTDDYTQEQGSEKWTSNSSGGSTAAYIIRFETNGGNTIKSQNLNKNATVTEPEEPKKDGYTFVGWYTDKDLTKEYNFSTKVTSGFTLYAKWAEKTDDNTDSTNLFADVEKGSWYDEAVSYVTRNNLFKGVTDTEFAPNSDMTRAMFVTVLYRLENPTEKSGKNSFNDVKDGEWYAEAVVWAAGNGVVEGMSETEFAPNDNITREQMAAIIYRYAKMNGYDTEIASELSQFTDLNEISNWALYAVKWANAAGLVTGTSETTISPKDTATRAQVAATLMRFCENIAK